MIHGLGILVPNKLLPSQGKRKANPAEIGKRHAAEVQAMLSKYSEPETMAAAVAEWHRGFIERAGGTQHAYIKASIMRDVLDVFSKKHK